MVDADDEPAAADHRRADVQGSRDHRPAPKSPTTPSRVAMGRGRAGRVHRPLDHGGAHGPAPPRRRFPSDRSFAEPGPRHRLAAAGAGRPVLRGSRARIEIVITMLPDTSDVEHVVLGDDGVASSLAEGALLIDMARSTPGPTPRSGGAGAQGVQMLDAPCRGASAARSTGRFHHGRRLRAGIRPGDTDPRIDG